MTEHQKIPTPSDRAGRSLLERAESLFGKHGYTPAPVPSVLAPPVNRKPARRRGPDGPAAHQHSGPAAGQGERLPPGSTPETATETRFEDVEFSQVVHEIDREELARRGLIQPEGQVSALLEEFRIVKRQVLQSVRAAREAGSGALAQRVLVCSPLPDEGKSYCAVNLALAMAAEKDSEVLLVDADFAKPSILSMLGLPRGPGFMDVLADEDVSVEDCVLTTDIHGLHVLPAGNHSTSDSEYLASNRTAAVLDRLTRAAPNRIVIFDSPPALAASPAAELAKHVGQAIVVARADRTGQSAMEDALTLLSACPDLKLLLNAAHFSPSGRRFGAYYGQEG
ncbi:AAA family ATPase [Aurantiacibacter spongiae]|uniref:Capsular biosynthesis protein n=1 Tax=Aurantiacibacter spongiae TaxID=2488860 RepID=A0A3N5DEX5_9SPHN|nr:AAA family ATPase [Aurantiacibacter spongiae]RPF70192.1 capsular biosynthesis protein [Aurantiacibacter spongiae]